MQRVAEAGSNAIHALLEKFGATSVAIEGKLTFAFSIGTRPDEFAVTVSDNANGLDDRNYLAFLTPFTGNKLKRGGKGFGRFVAFKVFDEVSYYSKTPSSADAVETRSFRFDVYAAEEIIDVQGGIAPEFETGCAVTYRRVKAAYHRQWENLAEQRILDHLSSNFLTYLVGGQMIVRRGSSRPRPSRRGRSPSNKWCRLGAPSRARRRNPPGSTPRRCQPAPDH